MPHLVGFICDAESNKEVLKEIYVTLPANSAKYEWNGSQLEPPGPTSTIGFGLCQGNNYFILNK
jgi:hypothetical protein